MAARDEILVRARGVFNDFGYRRASMGEVARLAGISRQGLYHHFPDKPALFAAVIEQGHADTVDKAAEARDAARAAGADFETIVTAMIDARFGQMLRDLQTTPHRAEIFEETVRRCARIVLEQTRRFHKMMTDLIQNEIDAGHVRLADAFSPDDVAAAFATMARGVSLMPPPDIRRLAAAYARHIRLITHGAFVRVEDPLHNTRIAASV